MKEIKISSIKNAINKSKSKSDVLKKLGLHLKGNNFKWLADIILKNNIDISHFDNGYSKRKMYDRITLKCPVCTQDFVVLKNHKRQQITCSHACANSYFRTGKNHPNWKDNAGDKAHQRICFKHHQKKCVCCEEVKLLDVHHFDLNHKNNNPENLIPLCATHHRYYHSRYRKEVEQIIINYREKFIANRQTI